MQGRGAPGLPRVSFEALTGDLTWKMGVAAAPTLLNAESRVGPARAGLAVLILSPAGSLESLPGATPWNGLWDQRRRRLQAPRTWPRTGQSRPACPPRPVGLGRGDTGRADCALHTLRSVGDPVGRMGPPSAQVAHGEGMRRWPVRAASQAPRVCPRFHPWALEPVKAKAGALAPRRGKQVAMKEGAAPPWRPLLRCPPSSAVLCTPEGPGKSHEAISGASAARNMRERFQVTCGGGGSPTQGTPYAKYLTPRRKGRCRAEQSEGPLVCEAGA